MAVVIPKCGILRFELIELPGGKRTFFAVTFCVRSACESSVRTGKNNSVEPSSAIDRRRPVFHRLPQVIAIWRKAKVTVFSIEVWQILLSCRADPAWNEGNDLVLGGDADFDEIGPGVLDGG